MGGRVARDRAVFCRPCRTRSRWDDEPIASSKSVTAPDLPGDRMITGLLDDSKLDYFTKFFTKHYWFSESHNDGLFRPISVLSYGLVYQGVRAACDERGDAAAPVQRAVAWLGGVVGHRADGRDWSDEVRGACRRSAVRRARGAHRGRRQHHRARRDLLILFRSAGGALAAEGRCLAVRVGRVSSCFLAYGSKEVAPVLAAVLRVHPVGAWLACGHRGRRCCARCRRTEGSDLHWR